MTTGYVIGINASRNRSGGAKAHIIGLLKEGGGLPDWVEKIHIWSYAKLLEALPDDKRIIKHYPVQLQGSILKQLYWERKELPQAVKNTRCDMLLNTDAGTVCRYKKNIVMSRDMLSYEKGEMRRYFFKKALLRLLLLRYVQVWSMRQATGVIFLTEYSSKIIQQYTGALPNIRIVPHGVGNAFRKVKGRTLKDNQEVQCLYVSHVAQYKHQWHVVRAISLLREKGYRIKLTLVGAGSGKAMRFLEREIRRSDPYGQFVSLVGDVTHDQIPKYLQETHIFIFASSCENMPNTLVEAMSAGLPIASTECGPMPEVLKDGGIYFDPESPDSIAGAVERLITNKFLRRKIMRKAQKLSEQYSWNRCATETWNFVKSVVESR